MSLVTGASRGIGKAIAFRLSSLGCLVAVNYCEREAEAIGVVEGITNRGGKAIPIKADVADAEAVKAMAQQVSDKWGNVDILVNNAGITRDTVLLRMSDRDWDNVIDTNLRGTYLCTKFALKHMLRRSWGRIINIASVAGIRGNVGQSNYAASKEPVP